MKLTHVEQQRKTYTDNETLVRQSTGMSMVDYYTHQFELGCKYLETIYPGDEWEKYYLYNSRSREYWNWWEIEFKVFEISVLTNAAKCDIPISLEFYRYQMEQMLDNGYVQSSFQDNYLKELSTKIF